VEPLASEWATWQSDNTVYAQLALDLGPRKIVTVAHRMGITSPLAAYPSIVLGSEVVNPLEVADAYATFAAEGVRHDPQGVVKVVFPSGHVDRFVSRGRRAIPAGVRQKPVRGARVDAGSRRVIEAGPVGDARPRFARLRPFGLPG
jgi:hypothetical protein